MSLRSSAKQNAAGVNLVAAMTIRAHARSARVLDAHQHVVGVAGAGVVARVAEEVVDPAFGVEGGVGGEEVVVAGVAAEGVEAAVALEVVVSALAEEQVVPAAAADRKSTR